MSARKHIFLKTAAMAGLAIAAPLAPASAQDAAGAEAAVSAEASLGDHIALKLLPDGVLQRFMEDKMGDLMDAMMDQMLGMKFSEMLPAGTLDGNAETEDATDDMNEEDAAEMATFQNMTMGDLMDGSDPYYRERMRIMFDVMFTELAPSMEAMVPQMREGLASTLTETFDDDQLAEMATFFDTPSGEAFGENLITLFANPELMGAYMKLIPEMIQKMPTIMKKVEAATAHLPKPPTACEKDPESWECEVENGDWDDSSAAAEEAYEATAEAYEAVAELDEWDSTDDANFKDKLTDAERAQLDAAEAKADEAFVEYSTLQEALTRAVEEREGG